MKNSNGVLTCMVLVWFSGTQIVDYAKVFTGDPNVQATMISDDGTHLVQPFYIADGTWKDFMLIGHQAEIRATLPPITARVVMTHFPPEEE